MEDDCGRARSDRGGRGMATDIVERNVVKRVWLECACDTQQAFYRCPTTCNVGHILVMIFAKVFGLHWS